MRSRNEDHEERERPKTKFAVVEEVAEVDVEVKTVCGDSDCFDCNELEDVLEVIKENAEYVQSPVDPAQAAVDTVNWAEFRAENSPANQNSIFTSNIPAPGSHIPGQGASAFQIAASIDRNEKPPIYWEAPFWIIRNSKVGACPREIWAYWSGFETTGFRNIALDDICDEGHLHETAVIQKLEVAGWELISREAEYDLRIGPDVKIRMHVDAVMRHPETGQLYAVEIKTMSQDVFVEWTDKKWKYNSTYAVQFNNMMAATGLPGLFIRKNRNSGKTEFEFYPPGQGPARYADVVRKILWIKELVEKREMPGCGGMRKKSPFCMFGQLHRDLDLQPEEIVERHDLEMVLSEHNGLKAAKDKFSTERRDELSKLIQEAMGESQHLIAGRYKASFGDTKMVFDEDQFKAENPELHEKYKTKEKRGNFRVDMLKQ